MAYMINTFLEKIRFLKTESYIILENVKIIGNKGIFPLKFQASQ